MKAIIPGFVISLLLTCHAGITQTITLTFSGLSNGQGVLVDKIKVENLDKVCDTTLFYPDSRLVLQVLDVEQLNRHPGGLIANPSIIRIEDTPQGKMGYTFDFSMGAPCPGIPTVTYGGQTYHTVLIGTQCWFRENLNIGTRINGSQDQTNNGIIEKYCFDDNEANCNTYGGLYQWYEMMQYVTTAGIQGICPSGWHIPTDAELKTVIDLLGGGDVAGGKMKTTGDAATNESGFSAVPAGSRNASGVFDYYSGWWSSTEYDTIMAGSILFDDSGIVFSVLGFSYYKNSGFSVRCLRD